MNEAFMHSSAGTENKNVREAQQRRSVNARCSDREQRRSRSNMKKNASRIVECTAVQI